MATNERDPDPARTPGLESGGEVRPGDTPPNADQTSGASAGDPRKLPNQAPAKASRAPMIITLVFIALITVAVLVYGVAEISSYLTDDPISDSTSSEG